MKLPRDVSGRALIRALSKNWGYREVHQVGSHIVLETDEPTPQRIVVPDHKRLRVGTLSGILRSVARHKGVSRDQVLSGLR
jgi:predicted RNA binding protein YcfA (HicA-like mRNA interferase family)